MPSLLRGAARDLILGFDVALEGLAVLDDELSHLVDDALSLGGCAPGEGGGG